MSVTFSSTDWDNEHAPNMNLNNGNATILLGLLGWPAHEMNDLTTAEDMTIRVAKARKRMETGDVHPYVAERPDYFAMRLGELERIVKHALKAHVDVSWG